MRTDMVRFLCVTLWVTTVHNKIIRPNGNLRNTMRMHNPPHPGEILSDLWLEPVDLSVTRAAEALDVSRKTLSEIVNGKAAVSPEMAVRLEIAFGKSAESWLAHQAAFDLWQVDQRRAALHVQSLRERGASA
jgi:addiction module HigA family antidote